MRRGARTTTDVSHYVLMWLILPQELVMTGTTDSWACCDSKIFVMIAGTGSCRHAKIEISNLYRISNFYFKRNEITSPHHPLPSLPVPGYDQASGPKISVGQFLTCLEKCCFPK